MPFSIFFNSPNNIFFVVTRFYIWIYIITKNGRIRYRSHYNDKNIQPFIHEDNFLFLYTFQQVFLKHPLVPVALVYFSHLHHLTNHYIDLVHVLVF